MMPVQDGKESNMINKLLGAAAMAAIVYGTVPASAANVVGCSGANQTKAESTVEAMADGPAKFGARREIAAAQDAMIKGNMRGCAMHLSRAMNSGSLAQAPYETPYQSQAQYQGPYQSQAQTPYQSQSQPSFQPIPAAK